MDWSVVMTALPRAFNRSTYLQQVPKIGSLTQNLNRKLTNALTVPRNQFPNPNKDDLCRNFMLPRS